MALLETQIAAVDQPVGTARGLPNAVYTDPAMAEVERHRVLGRTWVSIGHASHLTACGDTQPVELLGLPLVMVLGRDHRVRVFHNVCSHRGHRLVSAPCRAQGVLRCPYHTWTYEFDGRLKGTPHIGGPGVHKVPGFDKIKHGLREVRAQVWMDLVFVDLSGEAPPFDKYLEALLNRWQPYWGDKAAGQLRPAARAGFSIEIKANWKLAVENYCESYHLPMVHPTLNSYSRLEDHYHIMEDGHFAGQGSMSYRFDEVSGVSFPRFPTWPQDKMQTAEYIALYPNTLLGLQADHVFTTVLMPVAHDRTIEDMRLHFVGDAATGDDYGKAREALVEGWRAVFMEDVDVVEGMQAGRQSPVFEGGVFSPVMDNPTHHFHRWVARAMAQA